MATIDLPVLYSFRRCPYAIRTRITLAYCGQQVQLREVALRNKPAAMLQCSPKATVPVLVLSDNTVVDESLDIMFWALAKNDPNHWWTGLSTLQQQQARRLIAQNDGAFKVSLDRYKYADRYPQQTAQDYRREAETFLVELELLLTHHRFLLSDQTSLADVALFPFIRQFAYVDKAWFDGSSYPRLQAWLEHFLSAEIFTRQMEKIQPWQPGDVPRLLLLT